MFKKRNINKNVQRDKTDDLNHAAAAGDSDIDRDNDHDVSQSIQHRHLIRKLKRQTAGIDSDKLVQGGSKKVRLQQEQPQEGSGWSVGSGGMVDDLDKLQAAANPVAKSTNFTGQSSTIDVDKHMMQYIEQEMIKRRQKDGLSTDNIQSTITQSRINDPSDQLYAIAQKYTKQSNADDGSITRSESMLTKIPEVDLGVDAKLRNIHETEKAKQRMKDEESKSRKKLAETDIDYTQNRFMQPSLAKSRIDTSSLEPLKQQDAINDYRQGGKASDGEHYSRFRNAMSDRK